MVKKRRYEPQKCNNGKNIIIWDNKTGECLGFTAQIIGRLNMQQDIINDLKTYNLQHFLEWLVMKGYVIDENLKDITNVIECVNMFKEYIDDWEKDYISIDE